MADETAKPREPSDRRTFLKIGLGVAVGGALASAVEIPIYSNLDSQKDQKITSLQAQLASLQEGQVASLQSQVAQLTTQAADLQTEIDTTTGFVRLGVDEQTLLEAIVETIIPTDSNGPGAKEAGVIYFIDRQLASDYGTSGIMYMQGPFFLSGQQGPITVGGTTYAHGTPVQSLPAGTHYQYAMEMRYFWKWGLAALQAYANSAYGRNYQTLSAADQVQVLKDVWANTPTSFDGIVPVDFAWELFFMTWSGFLTDPLYGGNRNMVGWSLVAFNGTNQGDFYGEGHTPLELALSSTPVPLQPASLAQFQQQQEVL
jgi:gluconate 2-dehydrogenase gamma chain